MDSNGFISADELAKHLNDKEAQLKAEHALVIAEHRMVVKVAAGCSVCVCVVFLTMLAVVIYLINAFKVESLREMKKSLDQSSVLSTRVSSLPSAGTLFGAQPALTSSEGVTIRTAGFSLYLNVSSPELSLGTYTGRRLQKTLDMTLGFYHPQRLVLPGYLGQAHEVTAILTAHRSLAEADASSGSNANGSIIAPPLASIALGQPSMPFSPFLCTATVRPQDVKVICGALLDGHATLSVQAPFTTANGTTQVTTTFVKSDGASSVGCTEAVAGLPSTNGVQITYFPDPVYYTYEDGSPKPFVIDCPHYAFNSTEPCCVSTPSMLTIAFAPRFVPSGNGSTSPSLQPLPSSAAGSGGANGFCAPCVCTFSPSVSPPPTMPSTQSLSPSRSPIPTKTPRVSSGQLNTTSPFPSLPPTSSPMGASTPTPNTTLSATATATASAGSLTPLPSMSPYTTPTATLTALPNVLQCGRTCNSSILTLPLAGKDPVDTLFRCLCQCAPTCRCGYMPGFGGALERLAWKWPGTYAGQPYAATVFPNIHPSTRDLTWQYKFCEAGPPALNLSACGRLSAPTWDKCGGGTKGTPHLGGPCDPQYALDQARDGSPACPFIVVDRDSTQTYVKDMGVINDALTAAGALYVSSSYTTTTSYLGYGAGDFAANLLVDLGRIMFCANSKQVVAGYLYRYYLTTINPGWLKNTSSIPPDFASTFSMGYGVTPATVVGCEKPPQIDSVKFFLRPSVAPVPAAPSPRPKQDSGGCFAADARVDTPGGGRLALSELQPGQVVRVAHWDGSTGWERVLYVLHAASNAPTPVLRVRVGWVREGGRDLRLTEGHFLPTSVGGCGGGEASFQGATQTPAGRVRVGDGVWVVQASPQNSSSSGGLVREESGGGTATSSGVAPPLVCVPVVSISMVLSTYGVRSPLLGGGSIVVDGFAASTHSLWQGEAALLPASALALLPTIHNALLTPIQAWGVVAFALPPPLADLVAPSLLRVFEAIEGGIGAVLGLEDRSMEWPWLLVSALCMGAWVALLRGCLWAIACWGALKAPEGHF